MPQPGGSMSKRAALSLAAILAAAFALRAIGLDWGLPDQVAAGDPPFHPDEFLVYSRGHTLYRSPDEVTFGWGGALWLRLGFTVRIAAGPLGEILGGSRFATALLLLRGLNVLVATATVAVVYRLAASAYGTAVGLAAAALLACFPNHVLASHYARPDVLLTFLCAAALACACRVGATGGAGSAAAGGALAGLACATCLWGVAALAPLVAAALVRALRVGAGSSKERAREAGATLAAVAAGCATGYSLGSFETFVFPDAFVAGVSRALDAYGTGGFVWPTVHVSTVAFYAFGTAATLCAYAGTALLLARRRHVDWILLAFLVAGCALLSRVRADMIRHLLFLAPFVAIAAALALSELARRLRFARVPLPVRTAIAVGIVALPTLALSVAYVSSMASRDDPRVRTGRWIAENAPPRSTIGVTQSFPGDSTYVPRLPRGYRFSIERMLLTGRDDATRALARSPDYVVTTDYATSSPEGAVFLRALLAAGYALRHAAGPESLPRWLAPPLGRQPPGDLMVVRSTFYVYERTP